MKKAIVLRLMSLVGLLAVSATAARVFAQSDASPRETILVFAAASTTNALDDIRQAFQQQTGIRVQSSYASSGTLAQQIVNGANADIFLSADEKWAGHLAQQKLVSRQQHLLANRLVIVVPADSALQVQRVEDLTAAEVRHVAMGEPEGVPAGKYAKQALVELRLWEPLKGKVVAGNDVRHALAFVETGAAEAGIVYATDAAISKKVKVAVEIPPRLSSPIRYPVVLLSQGAKKPAAGQFYDYLRSPAASAVFRKYGFTVLEPDPQPAP
jgi:molybdate transport system substrate-binding protein